MRALIYLLNDKMIRWRCQSKFQLQKSLKLYLVYLLSFYVIMPLFMLYVCVFCGNNSALLADMQVTF